jgi:hypothetical protein
MRFRKKPVVVDAFKWEGPRSLMPVEFRDMDAGIVNPAYLSTPALEIKTLEGYIVASQGDWIIKGIKGEFYPCKPDIFAATYEPVE